MKEIINQLASQNLIQDIVEGVPIRIFWKDREGRYLGCNTLFAKDAGLSRPDELIGKSDFDMNWKDQAELYRADDVNIMDTGEPRLAYEESQNTSDGQTIWLRTSKVPLRDEQQNIIGILGIYEDITSAKHQQEGLGNSERELRNIFNSLQEAYYRTDIEGRLVNVSPSAGKLMACEPDALIGKEIAQYYVYESGREQFMQGLHKGNGSVSNYEAEIRREDGEIIWVSTNAHYFRDKHGNVTGVEGTIRDVTQLKHQEEQLQLTQFVSNNAPDIIIWVDEQARIKYANESACREHGYSKAEMLNMSVTDLNIKLLPNEWSNHWQKLQQKNDLFFETIHWRKDGTHFPIEVSANFVKFGDIKYNVTFSRNITERKKAEEELQLAKFVLDNAPLNITYLDSDARIRYINKTGSETLGYTQDEILQLSIPDIDPLFPMQVWDEHWQDLKHNKSVPVETMHRRKNGEEFHIEVIANYIEFGDKAYNVAFDRDITESKQQQELLKASQKRFSMLFDSSSDGLFIINMQGEFIDINKTAHERLGYAKDEMMSMKLTELDPPEFAARVPERLGLILEQGAATFETAHYRKDGSIMAVEINARIIELNGEKVFFSVVRDISERKKLEEQLRQSQKMEAIGTLVGGIAHDFNNMLAAIQGNVYLATMQMQDRPLAADKLANIEKLSARAAEMVQQLLTFARKDAVAMRVFTLNAFMREGYQLAKAAIPENIDHQTTICEEELYVKGDATQLQQVLMNLLNNAVDAVEATPQPEIHCSLTPFKATKTFKNKHPGLAGYHFGCITVTDNGHGISSDILDKIFEPFFTTKEVGKGTGLGLAMLYGAIQTHGGVVEVNSSASKGTVFRIYIPLTDSNSETMLEKQESETEGHGETILLVDDEENLRSATNEVLTSFGYHVIEADNGEQALDIFKARKDEIDLIISDVVMPRMGGVDLVKYVRKLDNKMPVMLVTGYDRDHVMGQDRLQEGCKIISKPFDFNDLSQSIQSLLHAD